MKMTQDKQVLNMLQERGKINPLEALREIGCFRLARGRGFRAEKRFLQHPLTPKALELFTLWSQVRPDLIKLAENWANVIKTSESETKRPHHPRKRRRKRTSH